MVPSEVAALTSARVIVDTVDAWNADVWTESGFRMFRLGVGKLSISE
jgi:hypothetical protein